MSVEDEIKKFHANLAKLKDERDALVSSAEQLDAAVKGYVPIEFQVDGVIKSYKEAVRKADSLTSMKPSVVKALNKASQKPTKSAVTQCKKLLEQQVAEVTKTNKASAKNDKALKKSLDKFTTNMRAVVTELEAQDTLS